MNDCATGLTLIETLGATWKWVFAIIMSYLFKTISFNQLVQMSINTVHLEAASVHLEEYVTIVTG